MQCDVGSLTALSGDDDYVNNNYIEVVLNRVPETAKPLGAWKSDGWKASSWACETTATKCTSSTSVGSLRLARETSGSGIAIQQELLGEVHGNALGSTGAVWPARCLHRDARELLWCHQGGCARQRRLIKKSDFATHSCTEGCLGCNAARKDAAARNHNEACPERLTTLITTSSEAGMHRGSEAGRRTARKMAAPAALVDALDEAMTAADVSTDTMAAAAAPPPADVDTEQLRGIKRPGDDELDDSTAAARTAARLLGAGAFDAVAQQEHHRRHLDHPCGKGGHSTMSRTARVPVNSPRDSSHISVSPAP